MNIDDIETMPDEDFRQAKSKKVSVKTPAPTGDAMKDWLIMQGQSTNSSIPGDIMRLLESLAQSNQRMYSAILDYRPPEWVITQCQESPEECGDVFLNSFSQQRSAIYNDSLRYIMPNLSTDKFEKD